MALDDITFSIPIIQIRMECDNIDNIISKLLENPEFILKVRSQVMRPKEGGQILSKLVDQVKEMIFELIHFQLEHQLKELIQYNNNILKEIQNNLMKKQPPYLQEMSQEMSFTEVHKLMNQERNRLQEQLNDASLDKSISAFVELKVETIEEKVVLMEKRLKSMEDKYETNLNSIWNVLSITESAIFDHLKQGKEKRSKEKEKERELIKINSENEGEKRSILGFLKFGSK